MSEFKETPQCHPLVSIAMCTYNGEQYLKEQIDSLLSQDYPNFEVIIVDDRSQDRTFSILQEYEKRDQRVRVFQNQDNLGFVKNFEKSISLCTGQYIALCDQDDIWFPEKVRKLVENIGEASLIYSEASVVDSNLNKEEKDGLKGNPLAGDCSLGLLLGNCVTGHLCLFHRDLIQYILPFPENLKLHDYWIAYIAACRAGIVYYPEVLSHYRKHENNVVLGRKVKKDHSKRQRRKQFFHEKLEFLKIFRNSGCTSPENIRIIDDLYFLMTENSDYGYNLKLETFLRRYSKELLPVFPDEEKIIRYLCKGYSWKFFILRFFVKFLICFVPLQKTRKKIRLRFNV